MKRTGKNILALLLACLSGSASGQWVVVDPAMIAQDARNQILDLAKYIEMINNQVAQINNMVEQLNVMNAQNRAFGNPAQLINISGAGGTIQGLHAGGVGQAPSSLERAASGLDSLRNNSNGTYQTVESVSLSGAKVARSVDSYRRFGVIENTTSNYGAVYEDAQRRRASAKARMAETLCRLQSAATASEAQKLQGVLAAEAAELQSLEQELSIAAMQSVVQDIANRNDVFKQQQAQSEDIVADRQDALMKFGVLMAPDVSNGLRFGRNRQ